MDIIDKLKNIIEEKNFIDNESLKKIKNELKNIDNNIGYNFLYIDSIEIKIKIGYINFNIQDKNLFIQIKDTLNNRPIFQIRIPLSQIKDIKYKKRSFIKITTHGIFY